MASGPGTGKREGSVLNGIPLLDDYMIYNPLYNPQYFWSLSIFMMIIYNPQYMKGGIIPELTINQQRFVSHCSNGHRLRLCPWRRACFLHFLKESQDEPQEFWDQNREPNGWILQVAAAPVLHPKSKECKRTVTSLCVPFHSNYMIVKKIMLKPLSVVNPTMNRPFRDM